MWGTLAMIDEVEVATLRGALRRQMLGMGE
jgi:hypothetical protein